MTETLLHEPIQADEDDFRPTDTSDHYIGQIENGRVGFGGHVVHAAIAQTTNRLLNRESFDQAFDDNVLNQVTDSRVQLGKLSEENRQKFNAFLNSRPSSTWRDEQFGFEPGKVEEGKAAEGVPEVKDYVGRLLERAPFGYKMSDEQFQNFLEWHNHDLQAMQKEIEPMIDEQKRLYLGKLEKTIEKGWIPHWVKGWAEDRIQKVTVVVDDGFATNHKGIAGDALRTGLLEKDEVVISPEELEHAEPLLTHEFTHVIDGYYENADFDGYSRGLYKVVPGRLKGGHYLNEAVVEHLSDSMFKDNDIDVIDPDSPLRQGATYKEQRKLLNILATKGKRPIDIRDFIAAHFDDGKRARVDENNETPIDKLRREIDEAFPGEDVLGRLAEINDEQQLIVLNTKLDEIAKRMKEKRENRRFAKQFVATVALAGSLAGGVTVEAMDAINAHREHDQPSVSWLDDEQGIGTASQVHNNSHDPGIYTAPNDGNSVTIPIAGHR